MASVTLAGRTYSDDSNPLTGLGNGGHRVRFILALSDMLAEMAIIKGQMLAGFAATSTSSIALGPGVKSLSLAPGLPWVAGMMIRVARTDDPAAGYEDGFVISYDPATGAMVYEVLPGGSHGTGSFSSWQISMPALPGPMGPPGLDGAPGAVVADFMMWRAARRARYAFL